MSVEFRNFEFMYLNGKGKPVFVPNDDLRKKSDVIIDAVSKRFVFPEYYYHFKPGGHVAALHVHRPQTHFAKLDLENFFYSIGRNRVKSNLKSIGVKPAELFARWSTVKNPYSKPSYSLPYGFPQSPILATLVLANSELGRVIDKLPPEIIKSVYLDDLAISSHDKELLEFHFDKIKEAVVQAQFRINDGKSTTPTQHLEIFNCNLILGSTQVKPDRIAEFHSRPQTEAALAAFGAYLAIVQNGNSSASDAT